MGRRRAALLFLVPSLVGLGWIALQVADGLEWFGASLFDPTFAATLIAILALLAVWRILALGHAFATAPGRHRFRKLELAMTAALVASIVVAHTAAIAGAWAVYETGASIDSNNMLSDSLLSGTSAFATATPSPSPTPTMTQSMAPYITVGPAVTPEPAPTFWSNPDRITFLLIGVDFMTGRSHALTDTMMLATLDVHTNKATLISVPRDTAYFPLYFGPMSGETFKLNELMSAASDPSFGSPDSGVKTLENEIGFLVGLPVDYYAAVDLEGFVQIVQALGGVDIDVKTAVNDPFTGTFVPTGLIHMDGHLALKYARSRESSSDYARARRQQEVLVALAHKVVSPDVVPQLTTLLPLAWTTIATDFPMKYARNFITAFRRVGTPTECVLGPPYNWHPDSSLTDGTWTSRLDLDRVAGLSVYLFGRESTYSNKPNVVPAPCAS
jgi:LCP family protein required for cell wall assembly